MPITLGSTALGRNYTVPFGAIPAGLVLTDRGGGSPVIVSHWGARVSWAISSPGRLSVFVAASEARALGASGMEWIGTRWAYYLHPSLPAWGGVVTSMVWSEDGVLELGCESFHVLLRKRRVPRTYGQQSAPAGALAQRAFTDVQADDYTFIRSFSADEDGDPLVWEWRGGDLMDDVFRQLATASNQEWTVNAEREAEWRVRIGQDKTASVYLRAPHEIVRFRFAGDLWTVANDIAGVATDQRYERSAYAVYQHTDSVRTFGRHQVTNRYAGVVSKGTIKPKISRDLHRSAWPAELIDLTTVDVGGESWLGYQVGDLVSVVLPVSDSIREVRIGARSCDIDAGLETLGCEIINERDGWD